MSAIRRVPRYHQIAQSLRDRIVDGVLAPGARLDNQRSLAREFNVTLMTLRQALDLLDRDGLITRRHGLGTFVASPSIDYDILHLRALAGDLSAKGQDVTTRFLGSHFGRPDHQVARELGLGKADRVFVLERLRLVGGRPMSFQVSCLPVAIGEEVAKADLARTPLRQVLSFKLGVEITGARETVSAVQLAGRAARELDCRPGTPAFRSDRVSLGAGGAPVVHDRVFIPGDRFRITRQFQYNGGPKAQPGPAEDLGCADAPMSPKGEEAQPRYRGQSDLSEVKGPYGSRPTPMSPKGEEAQPPTDVHHVQARWRTPKGEEAQPPSDVHHVQARWRTPKGEEAQPPSDVHHVQARWRTPKGEEAQPPSDVHHVQARWRTPKGEEAQPPTDVNHVQAS